MQMEQRVDRKPCPLHYQKRKAHVHGVVNQHEYDQIHLIAAIFYMQEDKIFFPTIVIHVLVPPIRTSRLLFGAYTFSFSIVDLNFTLFCIHNLSPTPRGFPKIPSFEPQTWGVELKASTVFPETMSQIWVCSQSNPIFYNLFCTSSFRIKSPRLLWNSKSSLDVLRRFWRCPRTKKMAIGLQTQRPKTTGCPNHNSSAGQRSATLTQHNYHQGWAALGLQVTLCPIWSFTPITDFAVVLGLPTCINRLLSLLLWM